MSPPADTLTSDLIDFKFPVIGFTPDREIWGFPDRRSLTTCGAQTLNENIPAGMELIGADGARFQVTAIHDKGRAGSPLSRLVKGLLSGRQYRIEYSLVPLAQASLDDVKKLARQSLDAFPDDYCLGEDPETVLPPLLASLQAAGSAEEIFTLLGLDSFESY